MVERFGAVSLLPEPIQGVWLHQGTRYEEVNLRLFIDVEDTPENEMFFAQFKQTLKTRFNQIDNRDRFRSSEWLIPSPVLLGA